MNCYLFVDFGSTNTKVTLVDIEHEEIVATAKSYTTVETDVMEGFNHAIDEIKKQVSDFTVVKSLACSSAAGGLKIVAIGLVPELTSEAAKRAALGAGAKVIHTYSHRLNNDEAAAIVNSAADIILLAGGTDGGDSLCITHNAEQLKKHGVKVPVVVAGNKSAADTIKEIFADGVEYYIVENVMPKINKLNVENARETIRSIFMKNIIKARGMQHVQNQIDGLIMPTPAAVLKAAEVLSKGTDNEDGLGELAIIDIGGATTDIHSAAYGDPASAGVFVSGLEEPYLKRTVEGDLGMRYSIQAAVDAAGMRMLRRYLPNWQSYDIEAEVEKRAKDTSFISQTEKDLQFDAMIAKLCADISMTRHAGSLKQVYSGCDGTMWQQEGKDLSAIPYFIGTGGILVFNKNYAEIMRAALAREDEPLVLKPVKPKLLLDQRYILAAMGLLATENADMAVRMMKKYLKSE